MKAQATTGLAFSELKSSQTMTKRPAPGVAVMRRFSLDMIIDSCRLTTRVSLKSMASLLTSLTCRVT